jgi:hypothetical protein
MMNGIFGKKTRDNSDSAVSEVIGSILLISVAVLGIAIVGAVLMSHSTPEKIPALSAVIAEDTSQGKISIYHDGGDALQAGNMKILVDGVPQQFTEQGSTAWSTWSVGDTLTYTYTGAAPGMVQIIYTGGSGSTVLASSDFAFNPVGSPITATTTNTVTSTTVPVTSHTITASAGSGGSISPSGTMSVANGTSKTFGITPSSGYLIANVLVDGVSVGTGPSYTFSNVVADHTIVASFSAATYVINASATTGGTISPSGSVSIGYGGSQSFTITANSGYHISDVTVDGSSVGAVSSYPFTGIVANHTIAASFAANTAQTITSSVSGTGGIISPAGAVSVPYGQSQIFTISSTSGYHIAKVLIDGVSNGSLSTYTFSNVVTSHTIVAAFALNAPTISGISPNSGVTGTSVCSTNLVGTNFSVSGTTVVQLKKGTSTITATSVNALSSTQITSTFNLAGAATGAWDVVVTNPDGQTATLSSGFTVTSNII